MTTREDLFQAAVAAITAALPEGWTLRENSSLAIDDTTLLAASELPLVNVVDSGEESTPPDGASRDIRARMWHWTAKLEVELYAKTRAEIGTISAAVLDAILADATIMDALDDVPGINIRPVIYPDGQPRAAAQLEISLPYSRR